MVRTDVVPSTFSRLRGSRLGKSALFLLLVSVGCGEDPILTKAREADEASKAQRPGGAPGPGIPTPPTPGSSFSGPRVMLSGTVEFPGYKGGTVRVSAFDGAHAEHAGNQPKIVGEARLERPGAFTMEVPESAKDVYLEAAVDEDGNGRPGPLEPQGSADRYPVAVNHGPQAGIVITLSRRAPPPGGAPKDDF